MSKIAVIYWSMSGNTEAMANAIVEGAQGAGAAVDVKQVSDITVDQALEQAIADLESLYAPGEELADMVALLRLAREKAEADIPDLDGIHALGEGWVGDEALAIGDPLVTELESRLGGKKVALFGSYGWGDGQWMRDWQQRVDDANASLYNGEGLIINEAPDDDGLEQCRQFGAGFAGF